jgi:hypothetical protein
MQDERSKNINSRAFSWAERSPVLHEAGKMLDVVCAFADT